MQKEIIINYHIQWGWDIRIPLLDQSLQQQRRSICAQASEAEIATCQSLPLKEASNHP